MFESERITTIHNFTLQLMDSLVRLTELMDTESMMEYPVTGSSMANVPAYVSTVTPGNRVSCINPLNKSGRCFTVINSSTTRS
ncbi:MAG TPA: hypothetical protein VGL71_13605, partial [Urbifossiella sp.]